jgi:6-pyruvoyl-tetrahydropterin synthase
MKHMLYCLEFKLFAKHYVQIEGSPGQCHSHSWNIAVYINANNHFKQFYKSKI